jgi:dTMP kinase
MFITFEGIDGCGKSTQLELLAARLRHAKYSVVVTREPGGTELAEAIRNYLLHSSAPLDGRAELLLFGASRAAHVAEIVRPALARGDFVLSDRFADSSLAYQAGGLGLDRDFIGMMNQFATQNLQPAATFFLDLDPQAASTRRAGEREDRIEKRGEDFQARVREEYLRVALENAARVITLNAEYSREELHEQIVSALRERGINF